MVRVHRRRLLFVEVSPRAGATPIYLAIAALVLVSLVVFIVAAWPGDSSASAQGPTESHAGSTSSPFPDGLRDPSPNGPRRASMRWM